MTKLSPERQAEWDKAAKRVTTREYGTMPVGMVQPSGYTPSLGELEALSRMEKEAVVRANDNAGTTGPAERKPSNPNLGIGSIT